MRLDTELQALLKSGELTSVGFVKELLVQINRRNERGLKLKALISVAPENLVLDRAAKLDAEHADGKLRGPLHGGPVLVKVSDNVCPYDESKPHQPCRML
jgi:amidase